MTQTPDDLPDAFKAARAADEPFWQQQEQRIQGALGQPCCTLSGISTGLISMPGNFAVIVHGEDECAACFRHVGPSTQNFYCTGLTERNFVTGETAEALDRCLRLVAEQVAPEAIFVLGACPVEVIGDRFETVVAAVQTDFPDIPMAAMHTSGLKVGSQAAMLDWMFSTLASMPTKAPVDHEWRRHMGQVGLDLVSRSLERDSVGLAQASAVARAEGEPAPLTRDGCVNLIGFPRFRSRGHGRPEVDRVLEAVGLHVVANYPHDASFDDWRAIGFAGASLVADRSLYPKLVKVLEDGGQQVVEVPLPTGFEQTRSLYEAVGDVHGLQREVAEATAEARERAQADVQAFRERFGGLRVAMGLRMLNNYEADQIAYQGLGDHRALAELGLDLTLMVQGPPDRRERFETMFERRGITEPFEMFAEPWNLSEHLGRDRFDVAYLADHCRAECRKAGVPLIVSRELDPYYEGVSSNLQHLSRLLEQVLRR